MNVLDNVMLWILTCSQYPIDNQRHFCEHFTLPTSSSCLLLVFVLQLLRDGQGLFTDPTKL